MWCVVKVLLGEVLLLIGAGLVVMFLALGGAADLKAWWRR